MSYIQFNGDNKHYKGVIIPSDNDTVTVKGCPQNLKGFGIYTDEGLLFGDYFEYIYDYEEPNLDKNVFKYTKDGHKYKAQSYNVTFSSNINEGLDGELSQYVNDYSELVIPKVLNVEHYKFIGWNNEIPKEGEIKSNLSFVTMFEYVYTEEELEEIEKEELEKAKNDKIAELNTIQQSVISNGVDVQLLNDTVEHFTLTERDQTSLLGLMGQVKEGVEYIPWHTSEQSEHCKYYSNKDMEIICNTATLFVTYHVTYFRDLRIYVNELNDKELVNSIVYGCEIPSEYKSDVLLDIEKQMGM